MFLRCKSDHVILLIKILHWLLIAYSRDSAREHTLESPGALLKYQMFSPPAEILISLTLGWGSSVRFLKSSSCGFIICLGLNLF